jgi:DNA-binding transcriptional LysR family regulator
MELRHLRYFVAVAEELHFGRAARRLNLAQPPLSQQIRGLEEELGVRLFLRTSRKVELTESGRLFLEQARLVLAQAEKARHTMRAAHRGEAGRITIGFVTSAVYTLVPTILREFNRGRPNVEIRCFEMNSNEQRIALQERQIEVGFNRTPLADTGLHAEILSRERFVLALPSDHPRARDGKLRLRQFANDGFIQFSRAQGNVIYDGVIASCQRAGFSPRIAHESTGVQTTLALVAAGLGVAMVPASLQQLKRPGVTYRELPAGDTSELELALVWRKDTLSPVMENFVKIAREVARKAAPT